MNKTAPSAQPPGSGGFAAAACGGGAGTAASKRAAYVRADAAPGCEVYWNLQTAQGRVLLVISAEEPQTCRLSAADRGIWRGQWQLGEQMPIDLIPDQSAGREFHHPLR